MEDKKSDIEIGFRDLAQDIEYRFESLERDKAWEFTVDDLRERIYNLESLVEDLAEKLEELKKDDSKESPRDEWVAREQALEIT